MKVLTEAAVGYQVTLTKLDKLKPAEQEAMIAATQAAIVKKVAAYPVIAATSSSKRLGLDALRADIADLAIPERET